MINSATEKLKNLLASRGFRSLASEIGTSERALRGIRDGQQRPGETTRRKLEAVGIMAEDWAAPSVSDSLAVILDRAESVESVEPNLVARLVTYYQNADLAWTDRTRAASIALRLASKQPALSSKDRYRVLAFAGALMEADSRLDSITEAHEETLNEPSTLEDILTWSKEMARHPQTPDRVRIHLAALQARAEAALSTSTNKVDLNSYLAALARDVVKHFAPLSRDVAAVFDAYGIESRPLAPPELNVSAPGYRALCTANGWRPRDANDATWAAMGQRSTAGPHYLVPTSNLTNEYRASALRMAR